MKRNIYICFLREESEIIGILNKIKQQCLAINHQGIKCELIISRNKEVVLYEIKDNKFILINNKKYSNKAIYRENQNKYLSKISSFFRLKEFLKFSKDIIKNQNVSSIYIRRIKPISLDIINFMKVVSRQKCKIFWEIPTYSTSNEKSKRISDLYDRVGHSYLSRYITKNIAMAAEEGLVKNDYIFITNGVNTNEIKLKENKLHEGFNLICVATFDFWHGYDRLIEGLKNYYDEPNINKVKVNLHMVGNGKVNELKKIVYKYGLEEYVKFHGVLMGESLNNIFDSMDMAVGNLGFHRVGIYADTSIKIREYCARGIPFISALKDSDFPSDFKYMMKVPADESPIDIESIHKFYKNLDNVNYITEIREYAEEHLTWEKKMNSVVNNM